VATPPPRFRIDPRAAPAVAPPSVAPAPPPAAAAPPPAPAPRRPRRLLWGAVAVVALLLVAGAAVAVLGFGVGGFTYPKKYLLAQGEAPSGLRLAAPDENLEGLVEPGQNPARFTSDGLDNLTSDLGVRPDDAWGEAFNTPSQDGGPIQLIALKFSSSSDADAAVQQVAPTCAAQRYSVTSILQDGAIVVIVRASGSEPVAYEPRVVAALLHKASAMRDDCGS
jgi:hypothetical protein